MLISSTSASMMLVAGSRAPSSAVVTAACRRTFAYSSLQHAESSRQAQSAGSSRPSRRSSRFASRPGADMVGPPDPLSNLRPVRYGSAFEESSSSSSAGPSSSSRSTDASLSITHPYSLNEFTSSSSGSSTLSWANAQGKGRGHSVYFEKLLEKLEAAELAHKLRLARADNFNQRFWQDNNARFIQALSEFRSRTASSKAVATLPRSAEASSTTPTKVVNTNQQESELDLDSDSLATFYSAWLKANAARHRAYNRQLWAQTFGDLAPAARYQCLRAWAKFVGALERQFGRS
ncbi:hypothetical protein BCV70DRAFT_207086 [Testicularia cyperi]|uniref:Uncharacterized protein n=1 Tax=Testicularia cyperi TaxID=1882483 RepID=A0A317XMG0_9BASI|nr:hypothetical protein BCV70DRAFT_207086 [Testicularia cyperi]